MVGLLRKENPRRENGGLLQKKTAQLETNSSLTGRTDFWEAEASRLRLLKQGRAVFVVTITYQPSGAVRPKVFMTPDAAHKHATQHVEQGHDVEVVLSTLTPTTVLMGGGAQ